MRPKTKARINHGNRGSQKPPKKYEAESWQELICESAVFGHKDQIIEYFNRMKEADQKEFLKKAMYTPDGNETFDTFHHKAALIIIENL